MLKNTSQKTTEHIYSTNWSTTVGSCVESENHFPYVWICHKNIRTLELLPCHAWTCSQHRGGGDLRKAASFDQSGRWNIRITMFGTVNYTTSHKSDQCTRFNIDNLWSNVWIYNTPRVKVGNYQPDFPLLALTLIKALQLPLQSLSSPNFRIWFVLFISLQCQQYWQELNSSIPRRYPSNRNSNSWLWSTA